MARCWALSGTALCFCSERSLGCGTWPDAVHRGPSDSVVTETKNFFESKALHGQSTLCMAHTALPVACSHPEAGHSIADRHSGGHGGNSLQQATQPANAAGARMSQAPSMYQLRCHALLNAMPTPSTVHGFACQAAAAGKEGCAVVEAAPVPQPTPATALLPTPALYTCACTAAMRELSDKRPRRITSCLLIITRLRA